MAKIIITQGGRDIAEFPVRADATRISSRLLALVENKAHQLVEKGPYEAALIGFNKRQLDKVDLYL